MSSINFASNAALLASKATTALPKLSPLNPLKRGIDETADAPVLRGSSKPPTTRSGPPRGVLTDVIGISQYSIVPDSAACAAISVMMATILMYDVGMISVDYHSKKITANVTQVNKVLTRGNDLWKRVLPKQDFEHRHAQPAQLLTKYIVPARLIESFEELYGVVGQTTALNADAGLVSLCDVLRRMITSSEPRVLGVLTAFNAVYTVFVSTIEGTGGGRSMVLIDSHPQSGTTLFATNVPDTFYRLVLWRIGLSSTEWDAEIVAKADTTATAVSHANIDPGKARRSQAPDYANSARNQFEFCLLKPSASVHLATSP